MRIQFWGVRGSLPAPQRPAQIRSKISAVLERLTPEDLAGPESRERFLAALPPWLFGTAGGNTSCVAVRAEGLREVLIFDAGTGIRELGAALEEERPSPSVYHIFFSHFHWDHIQGLPFFAPAYDPAVTVNFYFPGLNPEGPLKGQMSPPYFPIGLSGMKARKTFRLMDGSVEIGPLRIRGRKMNHPGGSYSFRVEEGERAFIYATDAEFTEADFTRTAENAAYFEGADLIVADAQYTAREAEDKPNWGHNAFGAAADFAAAWGIRRAAFFHHDPAYDDQKLYQMLQSAGWYMEDRGIQGLSPLLAAEGMEVVL